MSSKSNPVDRGNGPRRPLVACAGIPPKVAGGAEDECWTGAPELGDGLSARLVELDDWPAPTRDRCTALEVATVVTAAGGVAMLPLLPLMLLPLPLLPLLKLPPLLLRRTVIASASSSVYTGSLTGSSLSSNNPPSSSVGSSRLECLRPELCTGTPEK
jgi:hypothetical protein